MSSPVDVQVLLSARGDLAAHQAEADEQEADHQELTNEFLLASGSDNTSWVGSQGVGIHLHAVGEYTTPPWAVALEVPHANLQVSLARAVS